MRDPLPTPSSARLYVVDDDPFVLDWVSACLTSPDWHLAVFADARAWLDSDCTPRAESTGCAVALIDLQMPGIDGRQVARQLRNRGFAGPMILMSAYVDVAITVQAMREGFYGVLQKPLVAGDVIKEVAAAFAHAQASAQRKHHTELFQARGGRLSARERQVLTMLTEGLGNKQVAQALGISIKTIETHRKHIMDKLELRHSAELLCFGAAALKPTAA